MPDRDNQMNKQPMFSSDLSRRSVFTKIMHAFLLIAVVHQLAASLLMEAPRPGRSADIFFTLHEYGGYAAFGILCVFWIWSIVRRGETKLGALFPWFSGDRIKAVITDLRLHALELRRRRLPVADDRPLASAIHGLGLLTVTLMALTGILPASGLVSPESGQLLISAHKLFANLMWAYLIAHAGLAVMHEVIGERVLPKMFSKNG
ncbi:MAG: cytochrome b/b6 domain-containing protein [Hyphomonadaceae bacterium]|nr:cytochrome b/b6 domain-containing protein [Hyphomonadaceae bacterium]